MQTADDFRSLPGSDFSIEHSLEQSSFLTYESLAEMVQLSPPLDGFNVREICCFARIPMSTRFDPRSPCKSSAYADPEAWSLPLTEIGDDSRDSSLDSPTSSLFLQTPRMGKLVCLSPDRKHLGAVGAALTEARSEPAQCPHRPSLRH